MNVVLMTDERIFVYIEDRMAGKMDGLKFGIHGQLDK